MPPIAAQTPMMASVRALFELLPEEFDAPEVAVFEPLGVMDNKL